MWSKLLNRVNLIELSFEFLLKLIYKSIYKNKTLLSKNLTLINHTISMSIPYEHMLTSAGCC